MFSVVRCQMSMILLWRSPAVMTPELRWRSTSRTSLRARLRCSPPSWRGITMSSTPIEMPARVAALKPRSFRSSSIRTRQLLAEGQVDVVDEVGQAALLQVAVDERDDVRQRAVEEHAADGRVDQRPLDVLHLGVDDVLVVVLRRQVDVLAGVAHADRRVGRDLALLVGEDRPRRSPRRSAPPPSCSSGTWSGSRCREPGPATARRAAAPTPATGCCWRRASAAPPRPAPWATAARGRPSGRRRSRR